MSYEVNIDNFDCGEWLDCAKQFADYSIYQTWPYQQVRGEMDNQQVSRVIIRDEDGRVVTMCHVRIKHVKLLGLRIGYVQWGPLFRDKDDKVVCSVEALRTLRKAYLLNKVNVLRVVPNACDDENGKIFAGMLRSAGFGRVQNILPYRTFILPADDSEEGIRKRLRKSFRRDLKKAEKNGIEIREGCGEEFCKILEELYVESLKRKCFKGLDTQEFIKPQRLLSTAEKMNIIVAHYEGEPVSVHLASNLGDTAVVLLAASNEKGLTCGSSYLIWYRAAVSALNTGMKYCDLGGIDPKDNLNVYQFKSRMGGEESLHIGTFEICNNWIVKKFWHMAEKVYQNIRK